MEYIDMHCDTISRLHKSREKEGGEDLYENSGHVDLRRLKKGGALMQNFAVFICMEETQEPRQEALRMCRLYSAQVQKYEKYISPVLSYGQIEENRREGKLSGLLTIEEGGVCQGKIENLREFYEMGVRMMTLTWNFPNEIGHPAFNMALAKEGEDMRKLMYRPDLEHGLTQKGREFVEEMERLGMIVDVSHLSDAGFYDVLACAKKPFVASHSNARAVCPAVRNMPDDMIRKLAERGGVMGLNFCPDFLTDAQKGEPNPGTLEAILAHAKHIIRVGGVECLGLGSDFDGIEGHGELPDCSFMPRLADALGKSGLSQDTVEKIFKGNVLRVYKELLS